MKFSIVVPHYDQSISDEVFLRGMNCLLNQTFKDFEVLVYHDGPTSRPVPMPEDGRFVLEVTKERENNWGHSNRDRGIRKAKGEYIVHFNPDNILYPNALEAVAKEQCKGYPVVPVGDDIIIIPVIMRGMQTDGRRLWRDTRNPETDYLVFAGFPAMWGNMDAMQLIMKRTRWLEVGGWTDMRSDSDGHMYPQFVKQLGARYCPDILGEHW